MRCVSFLLVAVLPLFGCGSKEWTNPVADVTCGSLKLHFEERGKDLGFPSGAVFYAPALLMDDGHGWKVVDAPGSHSDFRAYARLLPPAVKFHPFDASWRRWMDGDHTPSWVLFVDPAQFSDAQYGAISRCLDANLTTIDAAWDRKRPPEENWELSTSRRYRLSSMLYVKDDHVSTLSLRWECPGGEFLKTDPPDAVMHCVKAMGGFCDNIGRIRDDGTAIALYPPNILNPNLLKAAGGDPQKFYGACRNSSGRSLFDVLKPVPWEDER